MERSKFVAAFNKETANIDKQKIRRIIRDSIESSTKSGEPLGQHNLIIVNEELAELSKEVSKYLRGFGDRMDLIQEMADVTSGLMYLQEICGVSTDELYKGINVKMNRVKETLQKKGVYQ